MVFHKDQFLVPYSLYSTLAILTKLLYIAMYTILQMIQLNSVLCVTRMSVYVYLCH